MSIYLCIWILFCIFAAKFIVRIGACAYAQEKNLRKLVKK